MDNKYHMIGEISVPEEKKSELTENVLKLLFAGGIRKVETIDIDGASYEVTAAPVVSTDGKVYFDYSIFEKKKREISYFDTITCTLHTEDRGYMEYGVVMNMIMTMIESYSNTMCFVMDEREIYNVWGAAVLIESLIGTRLSFPNRGKYWQVLLFAKTHEECEDLDFRGVTNTCPSGFSIWSTEQLTASFEPQMDIKYPDNYPDDKSQILKANNYPWLRYYVYELIEKLVKTNGEKEVIQKIRLLLNASFEIRKEISESEDFPMKVLAQISLKEYPPLFVNALAKVVGKDYWLMWKELDAKGYTDIVEEDWSGPTEIEFKLKSSLARIFGDEYEDRFLSLWGIKELNLSEELSSCFKEWKEKYQKITDGDIVDLDGVKCVKDMLTYLNGVWKCHLLDREFVQELLEHSEDSGYKKLMYMLQEVIDEDVPFFPELTRSQVLRWISPHLIYDERYEFLTVFTDALSNKELRKELFGL